jgi:hypothetical protein
VRLLRDAQVPEQLADDADRAVLVLLRRIAAVLEVLLADQLVPENA